VRRLRARRGSALILVLLMTLAVAALAIAAIFMTSSAGLLSRFYDRERLFRYAAESALEVQRSRLESDVAPAIPDTGVVVLASGWRLVGADSVLIPNVSVNVYAAVTGDTTGTHLPFVTLLAQAYDANGTRHVRRMDLRRESFSRYQYFVDSFPSGVSFGPGTIGGRVHSNRNWINSSSGNRFLDTVTVGGTITGTGTFELDSILGSMPVPYPRDSTYARLDTLANAAGLQFTPVTGSGLGSRLEFVAFDADNDGTVEANEGFFKVFDLAAGFDTTFIRGNPTQLFHLWTGATYVSWDDRRIQNQCGAFYRISDRWQFFPLALHRAAWVQNLIVGSSTFPDLTNGDFNGANGLNDYDWEAARGVLEMQTARCFPAGSPFLMLAERFTNHLGTVTGGAADTVPFGVVAFAGGGGRGGEDTTFTPRSRTCNFTTGTTGRCQAATHATLGSWKSGTNPTGISTSVRQAAEVPFLFAYGSGYNTNTRGVISSTTGPLYVSGVVTGRVTLRVNGRVSIVDQLTYATPPNLPGNDCTTQLGVIAVGDVTVVDGMFTRARRYAHYVSFFTLSSSTQHEGRVFRTKLHGNFMSLTGTVGVEAPATTMGAAGNQPECPEGSGSGNRANGGCLEVVGSMIMRTFTPHYSGTNTGFRYAGTPDRCSYSTRRPPFFPLTNRYGRVRTLEVEATRANTPPEIRTLLLRLKGKSL
jgi:hypothetical protein